MYLHTRLRTQSPPCQFRFVSRSDRGLSRDLSTATCACFRWSCFMTTRDNGHEQWQRHIDSHNTTTPTYEVETPQ